MGKKDLIFIKIWNFDLVWLFVDYKLISIHFGKDKTKSILFGTKHKLQNAKSLNIVCNGIKIKQHAKVKYLRCIFDETDSWQLY